METVIAATLEELKESRPCVLATVVRTRGSTPQKAGARLLVRQDGTIEGTLGGGCVEGDIWYGAKEILRRGTGTEFRKYQLNEEMAARDGLVCGGTMYFLISPLKRDEYLPIAQAACRAREGGGPMAVVTLVQSPSEKDLIGRRLVLQADGTYRGTLGSAGRDELALEVAREISPFGEVRYLECPDGAEVFVEGFTTPPTVVIIGGGHVGKAVSELAHTLGYRIFIVDDRKEYSSPERFPEAAQTATAPFDRGLDQLDISENSYILVATRGHRHDDTALREALKTKARYIGLLGSRRKTLLIYRELAQEGFDLDELSRVRAPVGLDIGALSPAELAVSILGEITMVRRQKQGGPLAMNREYLREVLDLPQIKTE